ncbi:hypothetical protein PXK30_05315 [Phaeobacter gallaeciensis]|uniref:hypothetical protein n=1 Tax=Phaeobacter gallaeciensis TaxID=60890 RepID=UPI00237FD10B|nr:hypothetical protein [Phaeobacter gallaeciensis]MDE4272954.1 hypothetical protein [Phaeobacter gallaeciensis]MDE4298093.1 hypothetical protein [Phaeobacter gallaeciensis]MDE4302849.1 hypothetical protein [Phaeobacter gallaeciensis]MDE4307058.1 hypothetical protein [Phaeobacter gallaeciensis]MDE4311523.1 hypothetical protein [Phaeobacter gallaeciensis]
MREYDLITRAKLKAKDAEFRAWRVINQELGVLVKFAFHSPNKMPDFTKSEGGKKSGALTGKAGTARLHQYLLGQALKPK